MKKKYEKSAKTEITTVGQLKKLLEGYDDKKDLAEIHVKLVKPRRWNLDVEFYDVRLCAETEDEAIEEATRLIEASGVFPQSSFQVTNADEEADVDD